MYPAATSFIPVTVALARFAESNSWFGNYPYWYLGSTPFKYLTGPIVPAILVGLHKIFSDLSFFDLSYLILITSHFVLSLGWGLFAARLSSQRQIGVFVGAVSFLAPWHWVWGLGFSELSTVLASAMTPWVLLGFRVQGLGFSNGAVQSQKFLKLITNPYTLVPMLLFALLLLTNVVASIPAIVGLAIIAIVGQQKIERSLKKMLFTIFFGCLLTLWWYEPGYWLTIFSAPSFGGRSAASTFVWLLSMLRNLLPIILAIVAVNFVFPKKDKYLRFALSWFGTFLILTILRFVSDPDFWMDWTAWTSEIEIGVALLLGHFLARSSNASVLWSRIRSTSDTLAESDSARLGLTCSKASSPRNGSSGGVYRASLSYSIYYLLFTIYFVFGWFIAFQNRDFWLPRRSIENMVEYRVAQKLNEIVKSGETVFLSGTTAFWLNSLVDVVQVRGGADQASASFDMEGSGLGDKGRWDHRGHGESTEGTED